MDERPHIFRNHEEEIAYHRRMSRAYTEGREVAALHKTVDTTSCPYRPRSDMQEEWFRGYKDEWQCRSNSKR